MSIMGTSSAINLDSYLENSHGPRVKRRAEEDITEVELKRVRSTKDFLLHAINRQEKILSRQESAHRELKKTLAKIKKLEVSSFKDPHFCPPWYPCH